jgi:hypothetical protein
LRVEGLPARVRRFNDGGLTTLEDCPRSGRSHTNNAEPLAAALAAPLNDPKELGQPYGCCTLDSLQSYLNEQVGIPLRRSRFDEVLLAEGLRWRHQETWSGQRVDLDLAIADNPHADRAADLTLRTGGAYVTRDAGDCRSARRVTRRWSALESGFGVRYPSE